ncbi:conserved hypothetical protein [Mycolicibacterium vanbaalenii PYR-1]|uniref:Mce-associated membrane protein n=1 Tax=Mycolicibacterium vanbaalenii (strain DSM 7251 / JCM 13017 / BCRC 16820 / KCTC 9966 / NRRL B-24157 / PYR-1) TaxID=350058 RepID=A1T3K6_MYCVP|nr:conserved hypothetical protein [Mycolicibacterium vanbaalenii PYR-1]
MSSSFRNRFGRRGSQVCERRRAGRRTARIVAFSAIPACVLIFALGAALLRWQVAESRSALAASTAAVEAATVGAVALLSYEPDTVDRELVAVRDRLTGDFRDAFTALTDDVVIPGAKQKQISSAVTVTAASSVSATESHAEVLLFVNQTTVMGSDPPTQTASSVRVSLDYVEGRWLIADFAPTQS